MNRKLIIYFTLLLGCFFYGQNVVVKDSLTLTPLEDVLIQADKNVKYTKTNHLGQATLPISQVDTITLSLDNYQSKKIPISTLSLEEDNIIYLRSHSFILNSVIVTGTNWKNNRQNTPAHVISLTESEIRFMNQATTADLLGKTNEVFIQKSQLGGGSPMIRGFAANRLLINVDGVNMNNAIFRSGNLQNIIAIDPFMIQNVEALTGPGSVMYGSDAIGGVLSFETKSILPSKELEINGDVSARYATATEEKTFHADIDISNGKFASLSSFSITDFGDTKMGKHGPTDYLRQTYVIHQNNQDIQVENDDPLRQKNTAYRQVNFLQKFLYKHNEDLSLIASIMYSKTGNIPRYDRLQRKADDKLKSAEWYYGPQEWIFTTLQSDYHKPHLFFDQWKSILSHQYFTESRHDRNFNSAWRRNRFERVNVWSWENNFLKKVSNNSEVLYGFDFRLNHVNSHAYRENIHSNEVETIGSRYPDGSDWNQYGVYGKYVSEINKFFNLEAGIRYSYVKSKASFDNDFYDFPFQNADFSTSAVTGSVGVNYKPISSVRLNTQFSTGFRAPNIDDIGKIFDSEPGNVVVPNPNLKPEYIYNIEAGVSKAFGNTLYLNLLGYYSWLEDALVRKDFLYNGSSTIIYDGEESQVQAIQNAAHARIYGGLIQMEYNILKGLKLFAKLNYVKGEEELDNGPKVPMRHAAPLFGNIEAEYKLNKLKFVFDYNFNGKVEAQDLPPSERSKTYMYALNEDGLPYTPDTHVFNISMQYKLNDFITTQLRIDNIFDRRYRPYSSGISAPGRNFVFSVRTIF